MIALVVSLPVTDIDRALAFYTEQAGPVLLIGPGPGEPRIAWQRLPSLQSPLVRTASLPQRTGIRLLLTLGHRERAAAHGPN